MTQLTLLGVGAVVGGASASWSNFTHNESTTDTTDYSFATVDIGTAAANRYVVVGVLGRRAAAIACDAVTVGGVSATMIVQNNVDTGGGGGSTTACSIWLANVPTGTTATIDISFDSTSLRCGYGSAVTYGINATAFDTATAGSNAGSSDTLTTTCDVAQGGVLYAFACAACSALTSVAWTGATEDFEDIVEAANVYTAGYISNGTSETGRTIEAALTITGGVDQTMCVASFQV